MKTRLPRLEGALGREGLLLLCGALEVSFTPTTPVVALFDWDGVAVFEIPLGNETYRVRYTARGMDAGHAGTQTEVSALSFWPAPAEPDSIVRQTSKSAGYWHSEAARQRELGLEFRTHARLGQCSGMTPDGTDEVGRPRFAALRLLVVSD
jgi:hypothetical protein